MAAKFPRLDFTRNADTKEFMWQFYSTNGLELARSSETYLRIGGAVRSATTTLGLISPPSVDGIVCRRGMWLDAQDLDSSSGIQVRFRIKPNRSSQEASNEDV